MFLYHRLAKLTHLCGNKNFKNVCGPHWAPQVTGTGQLAPGSRHQQALDTDTRHQRVQGGNGRQRQHWQTPGTSHHWAADTTRHQCAVVSRHQQAVRTTGYHQTAGTIRQQVPAGTGHPYQAPPCSRQLALVGTSQHQQAVDTTGYHTSLSDTRHKWVVGTTGHHPALDTTGYQ